MGWVRDGWGGVVCVVSSFGGCLLSSLAGADLTSVHGFMTAGMALGSSWSVLR